MDASEESQTLGEAVQQRRKERRLSQAAAAKLAGISRQAWQEIESGKRRGSPETWTQMERVLEIKPLGTLAAMAKRPASEAQQVKDLKREIIAQINEYFSTRKQLELVQVDIQRRRLDAMERKLDSE